MPSKRQAFKEQMGEEPVTSGLLEWGRWGAQVSRGVRVWDPSITVSQG